MAENFLSLQNRVLGRLIDAPQFVQNEVPQLIIWAIRDLQDEWNFPVMQAQTQFNTLLNTRLLGRMPADYKEKLERPYWLDQVGKPYFLEWWNTSEQAIRRYGPQELRTNPPVTQFTDIGQPQFLTRVFDEGATTAGTTTEGPFDINVWPLPDSNGFDLQVDGITKTYTVYVPYYRYLPELANPTDQNWFTFNAPQYIVDQATAHGFMLDWNEQRAQGWFTLAQNWKKKLIRKMANEVKSPGKFMRMRADVYGDPDEWRRS